jgi:hypothetical protein
MYGAEEEPISNQKFAEAGGCTLQDLNRMERIFCSALMRWKLVVNEETLAIFKAQVFDQ